MSQNKTSLEKSNDEPTDDNYKLDQKGELEEKYADDGKIKISRRKLVTIVCILACELCERMTYYSVLANLILFCTSILSMNTEDATTVSLVFSGTVYVIPVFGGYVADSMAGKYNTILGSGFIYSLGLVLLPTAAIDYSGFFDRDAEGRPMDLSNEVRKVFFFLGLMLIAIGTGGIKANVSPFGAQQVDNLGPKAVQTFFNWFYWFINAGALIAYSAVSYIQQEINFAYGFLVPLISMILAMLILVSSKNHYVMTPPSGSILQTAVRVCVFARCRKLDRAKEKHGGIFDDRTVDAVVSVLRIIPIFIPIIFYWAIYSQMGTTFFVQSERMDLRAGGAKLPIAILNTFNSIIILVLIPIMDRIVYPILAKYGRHPSHLQRIGFGMVLAAASLFIAGGLEIIRKDDIAANGVITQTLSKDQFNASTISMFAQIPQFMLIGASEVFTSASGLEFAFSQAPESMQGLLTGLFHLTSGLGNYVSMAIIRIVSAATTEHPWYPDDINFGYAENLLFLIGGIMMVNFVIFVVLAKRYIYRRTTQTDDQLIEEKNGSGTIYVIPDGNIDSTKL
ncbi:hypothetical protein ScPMuIL_003500 [Solemya velum]